MWQQLLIAFGLLLILEGLMPFLAPERWQHLVKTLAEMAPGQIRLAGLVCMLLGLTLVMVFT
ncbi:MAG: DUF2065 domain-containing protein [Halomonadaceae bacterium]|nr:MAG: DUF2065 domain-containing protein [Halomonadaceae bacterium]